jgi:hypothetical protein
MSDRDLFSEGPPNLSAPPDQVFDTLKSSRRRQVIKIVGANGEIELTDLALQVASQENDVEPDDLTDQDRKKVYVSLYQTHLNKLVQEGHIEYSEQTGKVKPNEETRLLNSFLTAADNAFK